MERSGGRSGFAAVAHLSPEPVFAAVFLRGIPIADPPFTTDARRDERCTNFLGSGRLERRTP